MASSRRYFILDEGCPSGEIQKMMCRVVADKKLPLFKFAPIERPTAAGTPETPTYNTNDIIPNILPAPSRTTSRKDLISSVRERSLQLELQSILKLDLVRQSQRQVNVVKLEAEEVKRYSLSNPAEVFKTLMENEQYAKDVRTLLEESPWGKAWLVIGFLTASRATWNKAEAKTNSVDINPTQPVGASSQVSLGADLLAGAANKSGSAMVTPDEEIFAVAYAEVKIKYMLESSGLTKIAKIGPARRAKAHHLAFMHGGSDDSEDGDAEEETSERASDEEENNQTASREVFIAFNYKDLEVAFDFGD